MPHTGYDVNSYTNPNYTRLRCSTCDFEQEDLNARQARKTAETHVHHTGHIVYVTVEQQTVFEPTH